MKAFIKSLVTPSSWITFFQKLRREFPHFIKGSVMVFNYFILLISFLIGKIYRIFMRIPLLGIPFRFLHVIWRRYFQHTFIRITDAIERVRVTQLKRSYLIQLAYKNLMVKKTRSFITILGMSVGVGIIVLLLSLGYGIERLIISRVASLDELRIIDVSSGENTSTKLNADVVKKLEKLTQVNKVIPLVSLVGRVNYNKANTDTVVYAAPRSYLEINKLRLIKGSYFAQAQDIQGESLGMVAGVSTKLPEETLGTKLRTVTFNPKPDGPAIAWEACTVDSKIAGYVSRIEGGFEGEEVYGGEYAPFSYKGRVAFDNNRVRYLGIWVRATIPLYSKSEGEKLVPLLDEQGAQKWQEVCLTAKDLQIERKPEFAQVLGEATESAALTAGDVASDSATPAVFDSVVIATSSSGLEVVELQSTDSATTTTNKGKDVLKVTNDLSGEVLVTQGFLRLLNIKDDQAVGKQFSLQFIVVKNLMPEVEGRVLTSAIKYTIKGVIEDTENQYIYVPFSDATKIGIKNYSQVKVVFPDQNRITKARKEIETLGFKTNSTLDTVSQIESLFNNLRVLLGLLGMVALGVASLGMFNTLTVSLLERTREIGGMKTMGVVSDEIQDLFLAEAMIMGLGGGVGGLILGATTGYALSIGVSLIAIVNGQGFLNLTYVPAYLTFFILLSSFIVGMITGFYPAQRAKRISALNALRYE